jgi:DNA-binding MarR family transcriptional regulator
LAAVKQTSRLTGIVEKPENEQAASGVQREIAQRRPFHSLGAEVAVSILRTAALLERFYNQVVAAQGITIQQYNVLRILRGAGAEGLPTLTIRDRMVHATPGITRLVDRLEQSGLVCRERGTPDRRVVYCRITDRGLEVLASLDAAVNEADDRAVATLSVEQQRQLAQLLDAVRSGHASAPT